jgi:hypothetical protein
MLGYARPYEGNARQRAKMLRWDVIGKGMG